MTGIEKIKIILVQAHIYNSVRIFGLVWHFPLHHQNNKKESIDLRLCIAFIEKLRGISYIYEVMYIRDSCNFWPRQGSTSGAPHVRSVPFFTVPDFSQQMLFISHINLHINNFTKILRSSLKMIK